MFLSLIPFHRGLITAAIVFCFGYGAWEFAAYSREGAAGFPAISALFFLFGFALIYYLSRLNRFLGYDTRDRDRE